MFSRKAKGTMLSYYFNLAPPVAATTFYLGLTTSSPSSFNTYELAAETGYERISFINSDLVIAGNTDAYSTSNTTLTFASNMTFPEAVTPWNNLRYLVIFTSSLGKETAFIHELDPVLNCLTGNAIVLKPNKFFFGLY